MPGSPDTTDHDNTRDIENNNLTIFTDSMAPVIYRKFMTLTKDQSMDISELSEFINYLCTETFPSLSPTLRTLQYTGKDSTPTESELLAQFHPESTPLSFADSLVGYGIVDDEFDAEKLLKYVVEEYVAEATRPPPPWASLKSTECEICERSDMHLTYHHLIPKSVHTKVLKRGWHPEHMLNSVAWICRPCHNMCHRAADNETLAREFYTIEKLMDREDMQKWAAYQSKRGPSRRIPLRQ